MNQSDMKIENNFIVGPAEAKLVIPGHSMQVLVYQAGLGI